MIFNNKNHVSFDLLAVARVFYQSRETAQRSTARHRCPLHLILRTIRTSLNHRDKSEMVIFIDTQNKEDLKRQQKTQTG